MYRVDTSGSVSSIPIPAALGTEEFFDDGTPSGQGTTLDADFLNMLQETLIDILTESGTAHSKSNYDNFTNALRTMIDDQVDGLASVPAGDISGLLWSPTSSTNFDIGVGQARAANHESTIILTALRNKAITTSWNTTTGALASNNHIGGVYFGRIFVIGKTSDLEASDVGVDQSEMAVNLMNDAAGDGFDTYRQVGWAILGVFGNGDLNTYTQDAVNPNVWIPDALEPTTEVEILTTAADLDVGSPEESLFFGSFNLPIPSGQGAAGIVVGIGDGNVADPSNFDGAFRASVSGLHGPDDTLISGLAVHDSGSDTLRGALRVVKEVDDAIDLGIEISLGEFYWDRTI